MNLEDEIDKMTDKYQAKPLKLEGYDEKTTKLLDNVPDNEEVGETFVD